MVLRSARLAMALATCNAAAGPVPFGIMKVDRLDAELSPLSAFIIPNGTGPAAALHVARTIARRAERRTIALAQKERLNPPLVPYLNRLSSLLFVLARVVDKRAGVEEKKWASRPLSS